MIKRLVVIGSLFLISACSNNEPAIIKVDTDTQSNEGAELVEQDSGEKEELSQKIEFYLPKETVIVNLKMVPILDEYLHATQNRERAVKGMKMLRVPTNDSDLYLLEFSCESEFCSYLLLDQSKDNQAYLVADLAKSMQTKVSPDGTKVLLQFIREASLPLPLTNLVVIDLENWVPLTLSNEPGEEDILNYNWPIINAKWIDNDTISALKPNIEEPTKRQILTWQKSDLTTTETQLSVQN